MLRLALIQSDLVWENPEKNLYIFQKKLADVKGKADMVVLPEMFTTGFTMNAAPLAETLDGKSVQWMLTQAKDIHAAIAGSIIIKENYNIYNRLVIAFPDGKLLHYDKKHLFTMGDEPNHYQPGNQSLVFEYLGMKIKAIICYDLRFPLWCRNTENYDLLLVVANWPEVRSYPWRQLLIARAIENQCYVAAVNRVGEDGNGIPYAGYSAFINPKGEPIEEISHEEKNIYYTPDMELLQNFRKAFPVLNDRDSFKLI